MPTPLRILKNIVMTAIRFSYRFDVLYVRNRNEFPQILNSLKLTGEGLEVGVWKGGYSEFILSNWKGKKLHSVDPWMFFDDGSYKDGMNIEQERFNQVYEEVKLKLSVFKNRSNIIRATSEKAAAMFDDNQLDFVYIDAQHHYEAVKEDIDLWYPKVKKGGILAGHDYIDDVRGSTVFGVKKAVTEFAKNHNLKVVVSHEEDLKSWYILKK